MATATILYDADCGFCRWSLAKVLAWDRRRALRPVALQDPEAERLLDHLDHDARMRSWHLVTANGEVTSGGAAFAPLLRLLPGGRRLAALPAASPHRAERAYRLVADRRSTFGPWIPRASARRARERIEQRSHPGPASWGGAPSVPGEPRCGA